ncbi:phenol hydroxylase subunit [Poseidonibacter sp.]|uniref:phenol hydroxylase subunit n=1 Tax=Poseidonibacter sp. TaxID=2321188 RepID=UPI003C70A583
MGELALNQKKYVHITDVKKNGLVEFDFAVDDPCMYVELALPKKQFDEFCQKNKVTYLTREEEIAVENDKYKWRYGVIGTLTK